MRQPTETQRNAERSLRNPVLADFVITAMLLLTGLMSGTLTLVSEAVRCYLMLVASIYALFILRARHRGRLDHYDYGTEKIESFVTLVVGLGLLLSGLWITAGASDLFFASSTPASPLGLAAAAIVNAVNAAINVLGWWGMHRMQPSEPDEVFASQLNARLVMMMSSIFLQVTLTIAALSKDPLVALSMDAIGTLFVVVIMVMRGVSMVRGALPVLLDAGPGAELDRTIRSAAENVVAPAEVVRVRTRQTPYGAHSEIFVAADPGLPASILVDWARQIRDGLHSRPPGNELRILCRQS